MLSLTDGLGVAVAKIRRQLLLLLAVVILFVLAIFMLTGPEIYDVLLFPDMFFPFSFSAHSYSRILIFGFALSGALGLLFGLTRSDFKEQLLGFLVIISAFGLTLANDFITLYFFWELVTISSSALILLHAKTSKWVFNRGMRFLMMHLLGGLLVLFGILLHYAEAGSIALGLPQSGMIFFILGFSIKTAFIPFHLWIAWGYPAASIYSAVILVSLSTKIGVYAIARVLPPLDFLIYMGVAMAVVGAGCAMMQTKMRELLSYSIISQVGYMVAGVAIGSTLSVDGALLHAVNHMIYKALLFMCAALVIYATGVEELSNAKKANLHQPQLQKPVWKILPVASAGAVIASLSVVGIPPMSGYVSKTLLKEALYNYELMPVVLSIAGVGTAITFCKFIYLGFLKNHASNVSKPSFFMNFAIVLASVVSIILGIYPQLLAPLLPHRSSLAVYSVTGLINAFTIVIIGVLLYALTNKLLERAIPYISRLSIESLFLNPLINQSYRVFKLIGKWELGFERNLGNDQMITFVLLLILFIILFTGG